VADSTREKILRHLAEADYRPKKARALAKAMGVEEDEYAAFRQTLKSLMRSGHVVQGRGNAVTLSQRAGELIGTFRGHPRGFGFVVPESPDEHEDLYIPQGESLDAVTGDVVRAKVLKRGKRGGRMLHHGRIVEVIARGNNEFVGELQEQHGRWFVWPDGRTLEMPIEVGDVGAKRARAGDQVVVEITEYPKRDQPARGVIVKRLGERGRADVAIQSVIHQFHLPDEIPEAVRAEARQVTKAFDLGRELARREDLRGVLTFTIDPDDAKDFDDAISLRRTKKGQWELGVHIADVGAFVKPDSALDEEAYERGNSTYFPGYVIPMLPEVLSNGLCSLQEGQPRLTKSVFITYDRKGRPVRSRFANAVIQSRKRLTYREATRILEGKTGGFPKDVCETLKGMEALARTIRRRRLDEGMLVLELPDVELVLDAKGNVTGTEPEDTSFSHTLIEMFMVEANEAVARLFDRLDVPIIRRIHPEPTGDSDTRMKQFLKILGRDVPRDMTRKDMQRLLDKARGTPEQFAVHLAVLRSLEKAEYSPKPVGHFALASEDYAHFTSPIRRYPDLTVHRMLDAYHAGRLETKKDRKGAVDAERLGVIASHCSFTERRSEDAEREIKKVLLLLYLEDKIGEEFEGTVTGVANVGVFVQLDALLIDGLIRFADLPDDWWELDERSGVLVGARSGQRIQIGDRMRVAIASIDVAARELDLALVRGPSRKRGRGGHGARGDGAEEGNEKKGRARGKVRQREPGKRSRSGRGRRASGGGGGALRRGDKASGRGRRKRRQRDR
jgi:ribonuclease R